MAGALSCTVSTGVELQRFAWVIPVARSFASLVFCARKRGHCGLCGVQSAPYHTGGVVQLEAHVWAPGWRLVRRSVGVPSEAWRF